MDNYRPAHAGGPLPAYRSDLERVRRQRAVRSAAPHIVRVRSIVIPATAGHARRAGAAHRGPVLARGLLPAVLVEPDRYRCLLRQRAPVPDGDAVTRPRRVAPGCTPPGTSAPHCLPAPTVRAGSPPTGSSSAPRQADRRSGRAPAAGPRQRPCPDSTASARIAHRTRPRSRPSKPAGSAQQTESRADRSQERRDRADGPLPGSSRAARASPRHWHRSAGRPRTGIDDSGRGRITPGVAGPASPALRY